MRQLAASVALATTVQNNRPAGLTVSSFCSLSTEPPRILVCVNKNSATYQSLKIGAPLAVNVLAHGQNALAMRFASSRHSGESRFAEGSWSTLVSGAPVLADCLTTFDCDIAEVHDGGTHGIVVADVLALAEPGCREPLLYCDGGFGMMKRSPEKSDA
ncbi:flavin reductase family protein [Marinobacter orientalis]|uniref:Flavin reductase n=1 Tax=Marinobacter orientalis TaxID=1928859 RepID=A0A7Y0RB89_9GAMM|nr:flavin reductase family protein [Marinobacter orientalis]NMT62716.1 flavin reductase [Marinobacter orientalis]